MTMIEIVDPRNHHRVAQRKIPGQSLWLLYASDFFHIRYYLIHGVSPSRARNDLRRLKIASTKVAGSIYASVEFTLQIVSCFVQLRV